MSQTSIATSMTNAIEGGAAYNGPVDIETGAAQEAIEPGKLVVRYGTDADQVHVIPAPNGADNDAIVAAGGIGSTASAQALGTAALTGAVGAGEIFPPTNLTYTFNSHTDWDATEMVVTGIGPLGTVVQEYIAIPNGGNQVITGKVHFKFVTNIDIPAQSGTNGTLIVGTGTNYGPVALGKVRGVAVRKTGAQSSSYAAEDAVSIMQRGKIYVVAEASVTKGAQAYVRIVATGDEERGAFRASADGSAGSPDAVPLLGATFAASASTGALVALDLNL